MRKNKRRVTGIILSSALIISLCAVLAMQGTATFTTGDNLLDFTDFTGDTDIIKRSDIVLTCDTYRDSSNPASVNIGLANIDPLLTSYTVSFKIKLHADTGDWSGVQIYTNDDGTNSISWPLLTNVAYLNKNGSPQAQLAGGRLPTGEWVDVEICSAPSTITSGYVIYNLFVNGTAINNDWSGSPDLQIEAYTPVFRIVTASSLFEMKDIKVCASGSATNLLDFNNITGDTDVIKFSDVALTTASSAAGTVSVGLADVNPLTDSYTISFKVKLHPETYDWCGIRVFTNDDGTNSINWTLMPNVSYLYLNDTTQAQFLGGTLPRGEWADVEIRSTPSTTAGYVIYNLFVNGTAVNNDWSGSPDLPLQGVAAGFKIATANTLFDIKDMRVTKISGGDSSSDSASEPASEPTSEPESSSESASSPTSTESSSASNPSSSSSAPTASIPLEDIDLLDLTQFTGDTSVIKFNNGVLSCDALPDSPATVSFGMADIDPTQQSYIIKFKVKLHSSSQGYDWVGIKVCTNDDGNHSITWSLLTNVSYLYLDATPQAECTNGKLIPGEWVDVEIRSTPSPTAGYVIYNLFINGAAVTNNWGGGNADLQLQSVKPAFKVETAGVMFEMKDIRVYIPGSGGSSSSKAPTVSMPSDTSKVTSEPQSPSTGNSPLSFILVVCGIFGSSVLILLASRSRKAI